MRPIDEWWFGGFCIALLVVFSLILAGVIYKDHKHQVFLREHGCQVVFEHETGRTVHHGRTPSAEIITLYECADGNRTEVH